MNRLMYEFQSRYLLVSHLCGREVDYYCMSARDRTGREQQFMEEMLIFRDQFGYLPRIETKKSRVLSHTRVSKNPADDLDQRQIALKVHEKSTSRSISGMNNPGGRAIKVDGKYSKRIGPVNLKLKRSVAANTSLPVKVERKFAESIQKSQRNLTVEDRLLGIDDLLNPALRQILHEKLPADMSILQTDQLVRKLNGCFATFQIQNALKELRFRLANKMKPRFNDSVLSRRN